MAIKLSIAALCAVGLFVSSRMQLKAALAARGELDEPSVVQTPRARLIGGATNSAFGIIYYGLMLVAVWFTSTHAVWVAAVVAAILAACVSAYLAYSLLFLTRMPCAMCWTGHTVNWLLLVALLFGRPR